MATKTTEIEKYKKDFKKINRLLEEWNEYGGVCGDYTLHILRQIKAIVE